MEDRIQRTYELHASTDVWTGSVDFREKNEKSQNKNNSQKNKFPLEEKIISSRLISTGLLGSIRWWFEVLVRGLDGSACDPTDTKCEGQDHCVVCELFGCTGWARKFRFEVLSNNLKTRTEQIKKNDPKTRTEQIKKGDTFCLQFTALRPVCDEEWALLDATLRLISKYGAIGGKTVFKPSDEEGRANAKHHRDYGIVKLKQVESPLTNPSMNLTNVKNYVSGQIWKKINAKKKYDDFSWASLSNIWFVVDKTLTRESTTESSFNNALGRNPNKEYLDYVNTHNQSNGFKNTDNHPKRYSEQLDDPNNKESEWLAGSQQNSKKVFSFKEPARTFGFVKPGLIDFEFMKNRLPDAWEIDNSNFITGDKIIQQLFEAKEDRS